MANLPNPRSDESAAVRSPAQALRARRAAERQCGPCSLCCSVLRVDELAKPAGRDCRHQNRTPGNAAGCGIHETRPAVCRGYRCLWLQGGLEDDERPDLTGGIVDLETIGVGVRLAIREVRRGRFDQSPALQAIAQRYRQEMTIRITDAEDVMNPDRPFRVLLPGGEEQRVEGQVVRHYRDGVFQHETLLPWAERLGRSLSGVHRRFSMWRARRANLSRS